jgi:hypothetical protein
MEVLPQHPATGVIRLAGAATFTALAAKCWTYAR